MNRFPSVLLLSSIVLVACGIDLLPPEEQGLHEATPVAGGDAAASPGPTVTDEGTSPTSGSTVDSTQTNTTTTGVSGMNRAEWFWTRHQLAVSQIADLNDAQGAWVIGWLRAATNAANSGVPVTHGTYEELANGTATWSAAPSDRLIIRKANGYEGTLSMISVQGDLFGSSFPDTYDASLTVRWVDASKDLTIRRGQARDAYAGFYVDPENRRRDLSLSRTGRASADGTRTVGTIRMNGEIFSQNTFHAAGAMANGEVDSQLIYDTDIESGGVHWRLSGEYGFSIAHSGELPVVVWFGSFTQNGSAVGRLNLRLISTDGVSDVVVKDVLIGSDRYTAGTSTVRH